jgi:hypothetical protein
LFLVTVIRGAGVLLQGVRRSAPRSDSGAGSPGGRSSWMRGGVGFYETGTAGEERRDIPP